MDKIGLMKLTLDGTKTIATRLLFSSPPSEKILDPMSTIIRLAILAYYPTNTKLSIHNNALYLQEPNYYQVPLRWGYGDDRDDLHNLHNPISKALDWYDVTIDYVADIFRLAKKGLIQLKDCYKGSNESNLVCHSLNYYSKLIDLKITTSLLPPPPPPPPPAHPPQPSQPSQPTQQTITTANIVIEQPVHLAQSSTQSNPQPSLQLDDAFSSLDTNIYNHTGITKLKDYWVYNELKLITEMFKIVDEYKLKGENLTHILDAINKIVEGKDSKVQELIIKLTTTLTQ